MNKILATVGSKRSTIVFQLSDFKGTKTLDIRKHYYNEAAQELMPTKKGISLAEKTYTIVQNVLREHDDEIRSWLENGNSISNLVKKDISDQKKASIDNRYRIHGYDCDEKKMKSPLFFITDAKGGRDQITINTNHEFSKRLTRLKDSIDSESKFKEVLEVILSIVVAFSRSHRLFDNSSNITPDHYFDTLLFNWGVFLQNYLTED